MIPMVEDLWVVWVARNHRTWSDTVCYSSSTGVAEKLLFAKHPHCFRGTREEAEAVIEGVHKDHEPRIIRESEYIMRKLMSPPAWPRNR